MADIPLRSNLHVDQLLTNVAVKYVNENFIHDKVFQAVPVKKTSDIYRTYTKNWRIPQTDRAPGALAREHGFEVGTAPYVLEKHALKSYIPDDHQENFDLVDLTTDATVELTEKIMMRKEFQCAALFTTTSFSLGVSLASTDMWNTGGALPILLYDTAAASIIANSGKAPNYGILHLDGFNALKNHTTVVDRVKYTSKEINQAIVGALISLPELLVPNMSYDSSELGAPSSNTSIWKRTFAFLGFKPSNPGFYQPATGYMFMKNKPLVRRWREEEREAEAIEVDTSFQFKVVASLTGYYINGTIS
jgi:hypothetical protein